MNISTHDLDITLNQLGIPQATSIERRDDALAITLGTATATVQALIKAGRHLPPSAAAQLFAQVDLEFNDGLVTLVMHDVSLTSDRT